MLVHPHIWDDYIYIGDEEPIPLLHPQEMTPDEGIAYMPNTLAKCEVIGTTLSATACNLCFPPLNRDITVIKDEFKV